MIVYVWQCVFAAVCALGRSKIGWQPRIDWQETPCLAWIGPCTSCWRLSVYIPMWPSRACSQAVRHAVLYVDGQWILSSALFIPTSKGACPMKLRELAWTSCCKRQQQRPLRKVTSWAEKQKTFTNGKAGAPGKCNSGLTSIKTVCGVDCFFQHVRKATGKWQWSQPKCGIRRWKFTWAKQILTPR